MDLSVLSFVALIAAGFAAGFVDAVVGGGGLIQLPALVLGLPGASPVQVLATNKLSSIMGTTVSAVTYRRQLGGVLAQAPVLVGCAFVGSLVGAWLSRYVVREVFEPLVLVVLIAVFLVVWLRPKLGVELQSSTPDSGRLGWPSRLGPVAGLGLLVGVYDGALGPGTGTFFVLGLVWLLGSTFVVASASAKLANWATNLAALVVFVPAGAVLWQLGLLMGLANIAGAYLGARMTLARGAKFVRWFLLVVVFALALRLAWSIIA